MDASMLEAELQPYQFLETDYNKADVSLTNDKTTASYIGNSNGALLAMTRPIGRDHRLILKILGLDKVYLGFTTCDTASLLANDKHLMCFCGSDVCSGGVVTGGRMKSGSQVSIRRTTDNRIEAVVSDASGGTSTEFWNMDVAADVPVVPVVRVFRTWKDIKIVPDETGLQSVRSQIEAVREAATAKKRHEVMNVMEKDAVIFVSVPVLRIRMKQVIKIESFSTFSGKRFRRILSQDRTHESYFEVKVDTDETRMNWRVRGVDQHVCADVDVMFSVLPNDPKAFSVVYDQPAASYKCSANAGQVYSLTHPTKQITEAIDPASPVTFQVDYQIVSVLKPVIGDVLAEPSDSSFPPKTAAFYMKSQYTDVKFIVAGKHVFHGHRTIISMRSSYFKEILFPQNAGNEILLPDASWPAFLTIMRFIYREELVIDKRFIKETLVAAEAYDVREVMFAISCLMDVDMLPMVMNHAHESQVDRLEEVWHVCLEDCLNQFLVPEKFCLLSRDSVHMMVRDVKLEIQHDRVWNLCVEWAKSQCYTTGVAEPGPKDLRKVMLSFLYDIRFYEMSFKTFTDSAASSGILKRNEAMAIYKFLILHNHINSFGPDGKSETGVASDCSDFEEADCLPLTEL